MESIFVKAAISVMKVAKFAACKCYSKWRRLYVFFWKLYIILVQTFFKNHLKILLNLWWWSQKNTHCKGLLEIWKLLLDCQGVFISHSYIHNCQRQRKWGREIGKISYYVCNTSSFLVLRLNDRSWHFGKSLKYKAVYKACFLVHGFEILHHTTIIY